MTEQDLMLLEEYLDGELSAADARAVEERAVHEPQIAAELNRLRADRQTRAICWRTMEGDAATVATVAGRVSASIQRRESFFHLMRGMRIGAAAAACIAVGLTVGFFAHTSSSPQQAARTSQASNQDHIVWTGRLASAPQSPAGYNVELRDETGAVVATQHFKTLEQAMQFQQDVAQWQQQEQQMHNGNVNLAAAQFYQF